MTIPYELTEQALAATEPSKTLVGPIPTVRFRGGPGRAWHRDNPWVAYQPPRDTLDIRYAACTDHHVACDCREAEFAEERQEWQAERQMVREVVVRVLDGHATYAWKTDPFTGEDVDVSCQCTGCQLVRAAYLPGGEHK